MCKMLNKTSWSSFSRAAETHVWSPENAVLWLHYQWSFSYSRGEQHGELTARVRKVEKILAVTERGSFEAGCDRVRVCDSVLIMSSAWERAFTHMFVSKRSSTLGGSTKPVSVGEKNRNKQSKPSEVGSTSLEGPWAHCAPARGLLLPNTACASVCVCCLCSYWNIGLPLELLPQAELLYSIDHL